MFARRPRRSPRVGMEARPGDGDLGLVAYCHLVRLLLQSAQSPENTEWNRRCISICHIVVVSLLGSYSVCEAWLNFSFIRSVPLCILLVTSGWVFLAASVFRCRMDAQGRTSLIYKLNAAIMGPRDRPSQSAGNISARDPWHPAIYARRIGVL